MVFLLIMFVVSVIGKLFKANEDQIVGASFGVRIMVIILMIVTW